MGCVELVDYTEPAFLAVPTYFASPAACLTYPIPLATYPAASHGALTCPRHPLLAQLALPYLQHPCLRMYLPDPACLPSLPSRIQFTVLATSTLPQVVVSVLTSRK